MLHQAKLFVAKISFALTQHDKPHENSFSSHGVRVNVKDSAAYTSVPLSRPRSRFLRPSTSAPHLRGSTTQRWRRGRTLRYKRYNDVRRHLPHPQLDGVSSAKRSPCAAEKRPAKRPPSTRQFGSPATATFPAWRLAGVGFSAAGAASASGA